MNLILLPEQKPDYQWPPSDPRVRYIRSVLRLGIHGRFFVGVENGLRGLAQIVDDSEKGLFFTVDWEAEVQQPYPLRLVLGLPRPQTARRVLQEMAALGVSALDFFIPEKGEPSYRQSKLWAEGEWEGYCRLGVEQACCTVMPQVRVHDSLKRCLESLHKETDQTAVALDVYEAEAPFSAWSLPAGSRSVVLALGAERGWSATERDALRSHGFAFYHLGGRVLRMETACVAGVALILSQAKWFRGQATVRSDVGVRMADE